MYNPTFIGDIDLNEDTLAHFGVKGMKWRRRKGKKKSDKERKEDYYAQKMADDAADGRRRYGQPRTVGSGKNTRVQTGITMTNPNSDHVSTANIHSRNKQGNVQSYSAATTSRDKFEREYLKRLRRKASGK